MHVGRQNRHRSWALDGTAPSGRGPGHSAGSASGSTRSACGGSWRIPARAAAHGASTLPDTGCVFVFLNGERLHRGGGVTELLRNAVTDSGVAHRRSPFKVGGNSNCGPFRKAYGRGHVRAQGGVQPRVILESWPARVENWVPRREGGGCLRWLDGYESPITSSPRSSLRRASPARVSRGVSSISGICADTEI